MDYRELRTTPEPDSPPSPEWRVPSHSEVVGLEPEQASLYLEMLASDQDLVQGIELEDTTPEQPPPRQSPNSRFQVSVPVPSGLSEQAGVQLVPLDGYSRDEKSHLAYTAITTDPQGFYGHYTLRPKLFAKPRHTEIFVGITVYNEQKKLLRRTLQSVFENIQSLAIRVNSKTWGKDSWKKVVVCILIDGMHSFEYSTLLSLKHDPGQNRPALAPMSSPVQLMLLLKASNSGKLNSYRWMYNAFAKVLDPNVTVHVDVGTKLGQQALYKLWKEFDLDPMLGAACGEITCSTNGNWLNLLNPIVAAQNFEYKVGFQLDRAFESATGFLSLLPGACSAYRYAGSAGEPLEDMLLGDPTWTEAHDRDPLALSPVNLNRHLADDRVICFQIISKKNTRWLLKYVPSKATTDIPMTTTDFINQRRRAVWQSDHSVMRKLVFYIPLLYSVLALVLAWFSLAAFLLTTFTINSITGDPPDDAPAGGFPFGKATPIVNAVIQIVYLATVLFQFILALGSRPRNHRISYIISFAIFGLVQVYLIMNLIYLVKRVADLKTDDTGASNYAYIGEFYADIGQSTIIVAGFSVFGVYVLAGMLALDPWHLFTSFAQFLFISSSYVNILNIYAFSNTHDVSWGKKGRHGDTESAQRSNDAGPAAIERRFTFDEQDPAIRSAETQRNESPEARDREYRAALGRAMADEEPKGNNTQRPKIIARADAMIEFRTILLASYVFSNFFVCLIVLNDSLKMLWWLGDSYWHKVWFFRVWLWANSISFLIRFVGCLFYHALRIWGTLFRGSL
ncbi:hypothetical protein NM208_g2839 [Fusarium decemcellulare]|uniref:Uncharacterized protein n=1 Tax=Fusarium decemcellulare TaxID=57161 RepID=A0ACC1SR28_9HYPO|nr:hypothetical protein NM208_g2839 [Fusarium decemcellulare]